MDSLQPYGQLRLHIHRASELRPTDVNGRCDAYCKVYLNDEIEGKSEPIWFSREPVWNWEIELDIFSPLSVVLIKVMDRDFVNKSDLIGFVEFCVADLQPNTATSGWFELRLPSRLDGLAQTRLRSHMSARDGPRAKSWHKPDETQPGRRSIPFSCCMSKKAMKEELSSVREALLGNASRQNAGHIFMKLEWTAAAEHGDEWYAFGLPRPNGIYYESMVGYDELDLQHLYSDVMAIKRLIWDSMLFPSFLFLAYITSWQSWILSSLILAWWWLVCIWPPCFPPSLPLCAAFLLFLLRQPRWHDVILFGHERVAPLTYEGFAMVASWNEPARMAVWFQRFVEERLQAKINDAEQFHAFAALTFRGARPVPGLHDISAVEAAVRKQDCILWDQGSKGSPRDNDADKPTWTRMPAIFVPDKIEYWIRKYQVPIAEKKVQIENMLGACRVLLDKGEAGMQAARRVYLLLIATSLTLTLLRLLYTFTVREHETIIWDMCKKVIWIAVGTFVLIWGLPQTQHLRTCFLASIHFREYRRRRKKTLSERWAFFTLEHSNGSSRITGSTNHAVP